MIQANTFLKEISYKEIVESLVGVMTANSEEFAIEHARFKETMSLLAIQLEGDSSPSVFEELDAIYQQVGSSLMFSCFLGLKANLDHYNDPVGRTFVDVDSEVYLRESVARQLPDYQNARCIRKRFFAALSPMQREMYEDVSAYISHLETVGPKLAHFYGYIMGNQLFSHVIPGYAEDSQLTMRYRYMLENYIGIRVD